MFNIEKKKKKNLFDELIPNTANYKIPLIKSIPKSSSLNPITSPKNGTDKNNQQEKI